MAQYSYQLINLTANIVLTWPFSFAGGPVVEDKNDVTTTANGFTITLPNATLVTNGQTIWFNNISSYSFSILANDGITVLDLVSSGSVIELYLYDSSTSNGLWRIVPSGGGTNSITAFVAESTNSSIIITGGAVTPPGGVIDFQLPTSINNLNKVATTGFPVITGTAPLTWKAVDLIAGENITITNPDGSSGGPVINLATTITGINSIGVGNLTISGDVITNNVTNGNIQLSTNGTGQAQINGVMIDINSNLTGINNLTVNGFFNNPFTPKAFCVFTDTLVGNSNLIVIQNQANITSITGSGGTYTLTFTTPMPSINYGVIITIGSTGGSLPFISNGYFIVRTTTYVTIIITDASGELVLSAPNGVTVTIMSN